ncbi:MAG: hypothetical protein WEA54_02570 [Actinomycetota bacterium]
MADIFVESWAPEYGSPLDNDEQLRPAEGSVDHTVEGVAWSPIDGRDDGEAVIAFVDGVQRVDARLTIDDPEQGPVPGLCGTIAAGATVWERGVPVSTIQAAEVERWAIVGSGRSESLPVIDLHPGYRTTRSSSDDPAQLMQALGDLRQAAERRIAARLAESCSVIVDGPVHERSPVTVGCIKRHHVTYLEPAENRVVGRLGSGQRTPLFTISNHRRYAWYVRLATLRGGHSWTGIVRCETPAHVPLPEAVAAADRTAALLPAVASEPHLDPRAPQNLVPIAALERELRHLMGDPGLVFRALRAAVHAEAS